MLTYNVLNDYVERLKKQDMPIVATTDNVTTLTTDDINKLRAGDIVTKLTGNQKHSYIVSYKENNQGICLTYTDASVVETVSYDYNSVTKEWVYNSTDVTSLTSGIVVEANPAGDATADLTKLKVGETTYNTVTKLYAHYIRDYYGNDQQCCFTIITNSATAFTYVTLVQWFKDNGFTNYTKCIAAVGRAQRTTGTQEIVDIYSVFVYPDVAPNDLSYQTLSSGLARVPNQYLTDKVLAI